ncbi:hypothetical protein [Nocardia sp. NPDC057030]|uniref:hypothetical protein n=1 Tax=unclassified Nocardia TaxID=2637762 RepID=UPI0036320005
MIATLASPLCSFRDFLGVEAADRLLEQFTAALAGPDRPEPDGVGDLATAVDQVTGTVCDLLGVASSDRPRLTFSVQTGDDQGRPDANEATSAAGSPQVAFLYWLYARPQRFCGGALRVYDVAIRDGQPALDAGYRDCPVEHDSIVFFPACFWSELRPARRLAGRGPVNSQSADPSGARFAIRGWIA